MKNPLFGLPALVVTAAAAWNALAEESTPINAGTLQKFEQEHHGSGTYESPIAAELVLEWQNEYRNNSDDPDIDNTNNSFLRAELAPIVHFSQKIYADGVLVFEPFDQAASLNAGDDIWFDREGIFAEEIKLNYESGPYHAWAGKFNPGFGIAWDYGRGIWGEDFAEDYEITEKLGFGGAYTMDTKSAGTHTISATTFFADTSFLSEGLITSRGHTRLKDGGASNTEDFSSFTVSLNGENLAGMENLGYGLSYRSLAEQDDSPSAATARETGFAATLNYARDVSEDVNMNALLEYAPINNFGGTADLDIDYYTASLITTIEEKWNITLGYTLRDIDDAGTSADFNDTLLQLSGGYDFGNGLTGELGWRSTEEAGSDTDMAGFLFRYTRGF